MKNKLKDIKNKGIIRVRSGSAGCVEEFFNNVIKDQFCAVEEIRAIHKALIEYINQDDAVFVLRLFGSDSRKNYNNLRRGFLTQYPDGHKMVFCDNTFAMPFAAMKVAGKSYTTTELNAYMADPTTRFGFGSTKEERDLAFYHWNANKANINLNSYGWYLAHIVPVGKHYSQGSLRDIFKNPKREEWCLTENNVRRVKNNPTSDELSVLKAHFLRMVHPLNSFLVPKTALLAYNGKNIGEEPELINRVQDYIMATFPDEYKELSKLMQAPQKEEYPTDAVSTIGSIVWSDSELSIAKEKRKFNHQKTAKVKSVKKVVKDVFDQDESMELDKTLKSIGKSTFLKLYPLVKKDSMITPKGVRSLLPEYGNYSENSQKSRLSSTKSIFNRGLETEALEIIISSDRVDEINRKYARKLIDFDK